MRRCAVFFLALRVYGLPLNSNFRTSLSYLLNGDAFPTERRSRYRWWLADAWGSFPRHFARRLTHIVRVCVHVPRSTLWILARPRVHTAAEIYGTHR